MNNPNCMNVCLANELLTEIDSLAKELGVNRDYAIRYLTETVRQNLMHRSYGNPYRTPDPLQYTTVHRQDAQGRTWTTVEKRQI